MYVNVFGLVWLGQSGHGSNGNEEVLHILQISKSGAWSSDGLMSYPELQLGAGGGVTLRRDAVSLFNSPCQLGYVCVCDSNKEVAKQVREVSKY